MNHDSHDPPVILIKVWCLPYLRIRQIPSDELDPTRVRSLHLGQLVRRPRRQHDAVGRGEEGLRDGEADAAACACYDDDLGHCFCCCCFSVTGFRFGEIRGGGLLGG